MRLKQFGDGDISKNVEKAMSLCAGDAQRVEGHSRVNRESVMRCYNAYSKVHSGKAFSQPEGWLKVEDVNRMRDTSL
jgi:hypothetical protein